MPDHPLYTEDFGRLYGNLSEWRKKFVSYDGILPFVSGLRFSVQILYIIKKILKNSNLDATWGHIVNDDVYGLYYSNECDIIIYKKTPTSEIQRWNGSTSDEYKSMDFKFIEKEAVVCVISCKSSIRKSDIDPCYPSDLRDYTKNVLLFAEYCGPRSFGSIKEESKNLGYKKFWCLYTLSEKKGSKEHSDSWLDFSNYIRKLASKHPL